MNKLQNGIILLIFTLRKIRNIGFVCNLIGYVYRNFSEDDIVIAHSQLLQYFAHSFITCQVLNTIELKYQNAFSNETRLNIKYRHFICQHIVQIYLIDRRQSDCMRDLTAAITASVIKTMHWPGLFHKQHLCRDEIRGW